MGSSLIESFNILVNPIYQTSYTNLQPLNPCSPYYAPYFIVIKKIPGRYLYDIEINSGHGLFSKHYERLIGEVINQLLHTIYLNEYIRTFELFRKSIEDHIDNPSDNNDYSTMLEKTEEAIRALNNMEYYEDSTLVYNMYRTETQREVSKVVMKNMFGSSNKKKHHAVSNSTGYINQLSKDIKIKCPASRLLKCKRTFSINSAKHCNRGFYRVKGAGGLIFSKIGNQIKLLIVHQYMWSLPKGYIEPNEDISRTAEREIYEETGLQIKILNQKFIILDLIRLYFIDGTNNFNAPLKPPDSEEIDSVKWVSKCDLDGMKKLNFSLKIVKYNWTEILKRSRLFRC